MAAPAAQGRVELYTARARKVAQDPNVQVTALASAGGAVSVGVVAGFFGALLGIVVGFVASLPLALFTFGLSIPVGCFLGAAGGFLAGSTAGGSVGGVGTGVAGYFTYTRRVQIRDGVAHLKARVSDSTQRVRQAVSRAVSPPKGNRAAGGKAVWFSGASVDGFTLLAQRVVGVDRKITTIGQQVGTVGDGVVIFLRHLGCVYCWSQSREWFSPPVLARMKAMGLKGPIVVAPGTPEQLARFLEANPSVPAECAFVDPSPEFDAYRAVGFGNMSFGMLPDAATLRPKVPVLGVRGFWRFLSNIFALFPRPKRGDTVVEGTMVLGGTFALRACSLVYAWADRVPGDYPPPAEVLDAVASGKPVSGGASPAAASSAALPHFSATS